MSCSSSDTRYPFSRIWGESKNHHDEVRPGLRVFVSQVKTGQKKEMKRRGIDLFVTRNI